jgi:hypothetical protein
LHCLEQHKAVILAEGGGTDELMMYSIAVSALFPEMLALFVVRSIVIPEVIALLRESRPTYWLVFRRGARVVDDDGLNRTPSLPVTGDIGCNGVVSRESCVLVLALSVTRE